MAWVLGWKGLKYEEFLGSIRYILAFYIGWNSYDCVDMGNQALINKETVKTGDILCFPLFKVHGKILWEVVGVMTRGLVIKHKQDGSHQHLVEWDSLEKWEAELISN